ncbi:MAG: hypothetical protein M1492_13825 [Gammaproteobacteria bacterium]|nr:hypothetical protein [Gammaproteobacteria bacterium]
MGVLSSLLSGILAALGLGGSGGSSQPVATVQTVASASAEMNQAVAASINQAAGLTAGGVGYANGELTTTLTQASAKLLNGILSTQQAIPAILQGASAISPTNILNTLSTDGTQAGMMVANYASQMPANVAKSIADAVGNYPTVVMPTGISGQLFY